MIGEVFCFLCVIVGCLLRNVKRLNATVLVILSCINKI